MLQSALGSHGGSGLSGMGGTIRLGGERNDQCLSLCIHCIPVHKTAFSTELLPESGPIQHALKLELWSRPYLFGGVPALQSGVCAPWAPMYTANGTDCIKTGGRNQFVWPAIGSDGGSNKPGPEGGLYRGVDRNLAPGALLAIPPATADGVITTTQVGAKIKQALLDFGGYFVDGAAPCHCVTAAPPPPPLHSS